jgi:DNA-binding winged helix-turn-helix (wHTH) protein
MRFLFEDFELDPSAMELRGAGTAVPIEPQVFALLHVLVENRDRLVSRDEIIEKVWDGRAVSDSALDSRIKSVRRALGDDGKTQRLVRTVHGRGFRFVGDVRVVAAPERLAVPEPVAAETAAAADRPGGGDAVRPSIAVLPFRLLGASERWAAVADALPDELITELARLRWLFVIARGSSFRFRAESSDPIEVGIAKALSTHDL